MKPARRGLAVLVVAALGGCATPEPPPAVPPAPAAAVVEPPAPEKRFESQPLRHLANRKLAPIPDRPLNVRTRCNFRDHTGYRGRLDLRVDDSAVKRLSAEINVPRQGSCRFEMKDFLQADKRLAVLAATREQDECKVRIWQQEGRVTVAFRDCSSYCSGESFDYVWPILVDTGTGKCS